MIDPATGSPLATMARRVERSAREASHVGSRTSPTRQRDKNRYDNRCRSPDPPQASATSTEDGQSAISQDKPLPPTPQETSIPQHSSIAEAVITSPTGSDSTTNSNLTPLSGGNIDVFVDPSLLHEQRIAYLLSAIHQLHYIPAELPPIFTAATATFVRASSTPIERLQALLRTLQAQVDGVVEMLDQQPKQRYLDAELNRQKEDTLEALWGMVVPELSALLGRITAEAARAVEEGRGGVRLFVGGRG